MPWYFKGIDLYGHLNQCTKAHSCTNCHVLLAMDITIDQQPQHAPLASMPTIGQRQKMSPHYISMGGA